MGAYLAYVRRFDRNVRFFLLATAFHGFTFFGVFALLLNLYLLRLDYGPRFIGAVNAVGPLALAAASLPGGMLSRRIGSRRVLIAGYLFAALGLTLVPLGEWLPTIWRDGWIMGWYAFSWLSGALIVINLSPYLMGATTPVERNYAFSVQSALFPVAGFAGNLIGGVLPGLIALILGVALDDVAPYRWALMVAGIIDLAAAIAMWRTSEFPGEPPMGKPAACGRPDTGTSSKMPLAVIGVISLVWLLRVAGEWTMRVFFNVYLDNALGASTALIGVLLAAGQLLGLAALLAPVAIDRLGKERTIVLTTLGMAVTFLPLMAFAHWSAVGIGFISMIALISLSQPAFGVFSQESVAPEWRTTIASAMAMALGIGIALIAFSGGYIIVAYGYRTLFGVGAAISTASALIFWLYFHRAPSVKIYEEGRE